MVGRLNPLNAFLFQGPSNSTTERPQEEGSFAGTPSYLYQRSIAKKFFDLFFAVLGLVLLSPLFLLIAVAVKASDGGPVFYRQKRVGRWGRTFHIQKFRTMVLNAEKLGPAVTQDGDRRITRIGKILRKTKLDELPQLWNVLKGEMSFVGPRPEVRRYVQHYTPAQKRILHLKPGITDLATLIFREEEALLRNAENLEEFYLRQCMPRKLELNLRYATRATVASDIWIILQTLFPYWVCIFPLYAAVLSFGVWAGLQLCYNFDVPPTISLPVFMAVTVPIQLFFLFLKKEFVGLLSFFSLNELRQLAVSLGMSSLFPATLAVGFPGLGLALNAVLINLLVGLSMLAGVRLLFRFWREHSVASLTGSQNKKIRVGIVGAGEDGARLADEISRKANLGRSVQAFFDDDPTTWHKLLHNVPVIGMPECLLNGSWKDKLDEVIIVLPTLSSARVAGLVKELEQRKIRSYVFPCLETLFADGSGTVHSQPGG